MTRTGPPELLPLYKRSSVRAALEARCSIAHQESLGPGVGHLILYAPRLLRGEQRADSCVSMTYTLYGGEILPRDPPRPPRCEALMHFSATQPSPRQPKSPRAPRSLPAMDPATIQSPWRLGAPVSGRPWSPGLVDAQGQWNPVVAEEVSPARLRAVPTSRAEAAALHDELLERLSAEPRLSYADQMRLVDFGMAEAARQARPLVD